MKGILVVEMNAGQMVEDVRLAVEGRVPVRFYGRMGGVIPSPDEVAHAVETMVTRDIRCIPWRHTDMAQEIVQELDAPSLEGMECVYERPGTLSEARFHYCPGCGHSVVHRVLMEVIEEMGIAENTVGVAPVGCSVFAYHYMNIDMQEAAHGRASAVATAVKRHPSRQVRLLVSGRR